MQSRITTRPDGSIELELLSAGGGTMSPRVDVIYPGQSWRGWSYRRLKRIGDGVHDLVTKAERAQQDVFTAGLSSK